MQILTTSTNSQSIDVIPRRAVSGVLSMFVRNESTNLVTEYTTDRVWNTYAATFSGSQVEWDGSGFSYSEGPTYLTINNSYTLTEDTYYSFVLQDTVGKIFKGMMFCTNQTIDQSTNSYYQINKNQYVTHSADNEFIIL
jgi:hypothetical protein